MRVSISKANSKMGDIPSVSLPAHVTCNGLPCWDKCYAKKLERLRPNVRNAYQRNLDILNSDPDQYWREVEATIMCSRFFRFHVSGDIPNGQYLCQMAAVAERNPHCQILCFTKKYEMINVGLDNGFVIPENLHIVLSGWRGLEMPNPYNLPEAHVRYRDGTTTAREDAVQCNNNCFDCAITDSGCWTLKPGEQVIFDEH